VRRGIDFVAVSIDKPNVARDLVRAIPAHLDLNGHFSASVTGEILDGIAQRDSFGPLSERHRVALALLRERFFPDRAEDELLPESAPLS
jgi:hypothetical protein